MDPRFSRAEDLWEEVENGKENFSQDDPRRMDVQMKYFGDRPKDCQGQGQKVNDLQGHKVNDLQGQGQGQRINTTDMLHGQTMHYYDTNVLYRDFDFGNYMRRKQDDKLVRMGIENKSENDDSEITDVRSLHRVELEPKALRVEQNEGRICANPRLVVSDGKSGDSSLLSDDHVGTWDAHPRQPATAIHRAATFSPSSVPEAEKFRSPSNPLSQVTASVTSAASDVMFCESKAELGRNLTSFASAPQMFAYTSALSRPIMSTVSLSSETRVTHSYEYVHGANSQPMYAHCSQKMVQPAPVFLVYAEAVSLPIQMQPWPMTRTVMENSVNVMKLNSSSEIFSLARLNCQENGQGHCLQTTEGKTVSLSFPAEEVAAKNRASTGGTATPSTNTEKKEAAEKVQNSAADLSSEKVKSRLNCRPNDLCRRSAKQCHRAKRTFRNMQNSLSVEPNSETNVEIPCLVTKQVTELILGLSWMVKEAVLWHVGKGWILVRNLQLNVFCRNSLKQSQRAKQTVCDLQNSLNIETNSKSNVEIRTVLPEMEIVQEIGAVQTETVDSETVVPEKNSAESSRFENLCPAEVAARIPRRPDVHPRVDSSSSFRGETCLPPVTPSVESVRVKESVSLRNVARSQKSDVDQMTKLTGGTDSQCWRGCGKRNVM